MFSASAVKVALTTRLFRHHQRGRFAVFPPPMRQRRPRKHLNECRHTMRNHGEARQKNAKSTPPRERERETPVPSVSVPPLWTDSFALGPPYT